MKQRISEWGFSFAVLCAIAGAGCDGAATRQSLDEPLGAALQADSQDLSPPQIACASPGDCELTPVVDATAGPGQISASIHMLDAPAGVLLASVALHSPSNTQFGGITVLGPQVSGTPQDGVFQGFSSIPQFAEAGEWGVTGIVVIDNVGNQNFYATAELAALGFPTTVTVLSDSDLAAPTLSCASPGDCALTPVVDVTAGAGQISATAHFLDAQSGFQLASVALHSPSNTQFGGITVLGPQVSGTPQDGVFQGFSSIPQFAEAGAWEVTGMVVIDNVGNQKFVATAELAALGFPTTLTVVSQTDSAAPVLSCASPGDCALTPSVDASGGDAPISATGHFLDNPAGFLLASVALHSPSNTQFGGITVLGPQVSGTPQDGVFQGFSSIPQFAENGVWTVTNMVVLDNVSNLKIYSTSELVELGFPTTLHVCHATEACDDANVCTTGEACDDGFCSGGAPVSCDDGDPCTADSCDPVSGCAHAAIPGCPAECEPSEPVCVTVQRGVLGDVADAFLSGDFPTWATGSEQGLWLGGSAGGLENRPLYRFDLSAIPAGAQVTSASFQLYISWSVASTSVEIHRLLAPWSEPFVTAQSYDLGNIDGATTATFLTGDVGFTSADITALAAGWHDGTLPNHGIALVEPPSHSHHTFSSESSSAVQPRLVICYAACAP